PVPCVSSGLLVHPEAKLHIAVIAPVWMALWVGVILFNNHLYNVLDFKFPLTLVTWQLVFVTIMTQVLQRTTRLLDGMKDAPMNKDLFLRSILPIGVFSGGSLALGNAAYLHMSISYIMAMKAFTPLVVFLVARPVDLNWKSVISVSIACGGIALTTTGVFIFDPVGFALQGTAIVADALRLVLIESLLHRGNAPVPPLVALHYFAPVCALGNLLLLPFTEGAAPFRHLARIGPQLFLVNALVAFFLNVAMVYVIDTSGALGFALSGVGKDVLLITVAVVFFAAQVSSLEVAGE
ncbi:hypothetical protein C8R46DRAFT_910761, partial [Mycena filopes]